MIGFLSIKRGNPGLALGLGLVLGLAGCAGDRREGPATDRPRDVILLTVDTLRRDHLGAYGHPDVRTPTLDRLARQGSLAELAVAPFGRTTQSVGTILTGLHPLRHGADYLGATLRGDVQTLAEILDAAGYHTEGFVANRSLEAALGFDQGFAAFTNRENWWAGNPGHEVVAAAAECVRAWRGESAGVERRERPLFLWVHLLEPHWPYVPRRELAAARVPERGGDTRFPRGIPPGEARGHLVFAADERLDSAEIDYGRRLYGLEVEEADDALRELGRELEADDVLAGAVLLFTSDHGESLGEHRYWFSHGQYAYESSLQVPLFVIAPGIVPPRTTLRGTVRLADVAPTLLDLAGVEVDDFPSAPTELDGRSVAEALRTGRAASPAPALHLTDHTKVSTLNPRQPVKGRAGRWWVLRDHDWKLVRIPLGDERFDEELFDLATDPGEVSDRLADRPDVANRLRDRLVALEEAWRATADLSSGDAAPESLDAARIEALRSLGYID